MIPYTFMYFMEQLRWFFFQNLTDFAEAAEILMIVTSQHKNIMILPVTTNHKAARQRLLKKILHSVCLFQSLSQLQGVSKRNVKNTECIRYKLHIVVI